MMQKVGLLIHDFNLDSTTVYTYIIFDIELQCSIFLPGGILRGSRRERLLSKFVENECEKIDRLMELYIR